MMRQWFVLPQRENEYETFAAHVLHYTLLVLLCVALSFVFFVSSPSQLIYIPVLVAILGGCYYLLHSGRFRLASLIFTGGLWLVITVASFNINGIRNASISSYAIVIIFSAILFSDRAVVIYTAISLLTSIILFLGETAGVLPFRTTPLYLPDRFFQQVALFSAAGILLSAASRVIRANSKRIYKHEKMLLERNQALELEIAERKRSEANLRISEEKYRLLFENIPVMAGVYAQDGKIILLNKAAAQTFSGTPESLQGRNLRDVFTWEDAERAITNQVRVIAEQKDVLIESKTDLPDGREFHYLRHIIPLPNLTSGSTPQVLVLTTDLTAKYVAEQRERELALAVEKNAFLTDFFSTLSHDLKTPLTVMNTTMYLLKRAENDQQREERMTRMSEQVTLMDKYIQDMLIISRLEHMPTLYFQEVDLNGLIEEVIALLRPRIEGKQIAFQFTSQPQLPAVKGDQEQLRRMVMNLIENAVNYTPIAGQVSVKTYTMNDQVVLEVADNGIGIEPDAVTHIFERFFRAANATALERSGTGLGLAIVKKIVDTHTATIQVDSHLGEGTTFSIQFAATPLAS